MTTTTVSRTRQILNKVPEVTIYFWIIKCLCTTIGETMSDNLMGRVAVGGDNATPDQLQVALYKVAAITVVVLIALLAVQFRLKRYVPAVYWANIVVISVLGTQITDMFEGQGDQPNNMWAITIVSVAILESVFLAWWLVERTLSMHSIRTYRREAFYWLAILATFATGTAVGDLIAEKFNLGYLTTLGLFAAIIAVIAVLWKLTPINGVLAFWLAYIMTRPLGASTGDWLSQQGNQGLNLGTTTTSYLFLGIIVALVIYLQIRKPDVTPVELVNADEVHHPHLPHPHLPHPHLPHVEGRSPEASES
ncbi:MAG: COG4705 family protein [Marmoricola sp.]